MLDSPQLCAYEIKPYKTLLAPAILSLITMSVHLSPLYEQIATVASLSTYPSISGGLCIRFLMSAIKLPSKFSFWTDPILAPNC